MSVLIDALVLGIALLHGYFLWLEMFAWTTIGRKTFKHFPPDLFEKTKVLAANQGLYNGFLAAGLIWSLLIQDELWAFQTGIFFLCCVFIAGIYGGYSVSVRVFYIQGLPALLALVLSVWMHL